MIRIDKHITVLDFPTFKYPHCNCLWIEDDINCLIDTSPGESDLDYLQKEQVDLIINTHGHIDHRLYNDCFPKSKILMHSADHLLAQSSEAFLDLFGFKSLLNKPEVDHLIIEGFHYQNTRIDGTIEDKQLIKLGNTSFETLHLPGHSPGHCGFLFPEQGFVFTADIDLSAFGPWYGNLNCSLAEFLQSIDRLLEIKPDYIITGHGGPIIKDKVSYGIIKYRDIIYERQRRILDLLHRGHNTLDDIAKELPIYQILASNNPVFIIHEKVMVLSHLKYLQELGYVVKDDDRYFLKDSVHPSLI